MKQVNLRFEENEHAMLKALSSLAGKSIPALVKECAMNEMRSKAITIALELYKNDKIGLKSAWKLTGLSFYEFSKLLIENDIDPSIPDELDEKMVERVRNLDIERIFPGKKVESLRRSVYPDAEGE